MAGIFALPFKGEFSPEIGNANASRERRRRAMASARLLYSADVRFAQPGAFVAAALRSAGRHREMTALAAINADVEHIEVCAPFGSDEPRNEVIRIGRHEGRIRVLQPTIM